MRLLNAAAYDPGTGKLEIIERWGDAVPPYAIFSHTWSDSEVTFADVLNGTYLGRPSFFKLESAIMQAKRDGWAWLWADNCCIDKTNSVELSEAINSMFKYYKNAQVCYAYLADVCTESWKSNIANARWWKRGWTLQELIAPPCLEFYSNTWVSLGFRDNLHETITAITGIEEEYLMGHPIEHASIAKRMSWAANRETTRDEDIAYCLIGMFDVNMPMLYGEGKQKAFVRLQQEIMQGSEDHSIFAWTKPEDDSMMHGLLADSPRDFKDTGPTTAFTADVDYIPSTMTARGLHISLPLVHKENGIWVAALQCPGLGYRSRLAVYLEKLPTGTNQYARTRCQELASVAGVGQPQAVYVRQRFLSILPSFDRPHWFQIRKLDCATTYPELASYEIIEQRSIDLGDNGRVPSRVPNPPPQNWSSVPLVYSIDKRPRALAAALLIRRTYDGQGFMLLLGAYSDFSVGFCAEAIDVTESLPSFRKLQDIFIPQPARTHIVLDLHTVRVSVEERVEEGPIGHGKIYFVDLDVQAKTKLPTIKQLMDDLTRREARVDGDTIANAANRDTRALRVTVRDKMKHLWL